MSEQTKRSNAESHQPSRRQFIERSTASVVVGGVAATLNARMAHASDDETIKVGLIGCGGRGRSAAMNAMQADTGVQLTAVGDLFPDQAARARRAIQANAVAREIPERFAVEEDHVFSGFDAYQQVIDSGVDVVCLCSTPHFRPRHLRAAIEAGKHVFCEKPVAVDPAGVRSVLETTKMAKEKGLNIVSGLCWRYDKAVKETAQRVMDGAIGDLVCMQMNYLTGTLWHRSRKPDWSEMEYQIRNWLYYTWLSGDHICEQHIHSLDKAVWLMNDEMPARCFGLGGRQVRTEEKWGNIYDHHAVCYEYENGLKVFAYTRQMGGCANDVDDYIYGTKGKAEMLSNSISGENEWKFEGPKKNMYDLEHDALFAAIRTGKPINNGVYMAHSTMVAIMGRLACYTGQIIETEHAMKLPLDYSLAKYEFGDVEIPEVPMPGITKLPPLPEPTEPA